MDIATCNEESATLVLGSILVAASFCFSGFSSDCFDSDSCELGLTIGIAKTVA